MRKRNDLPKLDASKFKKVENSKLSFVVGGTGMPGFSFRPVGKAGSMAYTWDGEF